MERIGEIKKVLLVTLFLNFLVSLTKIVLGYTIKSVAILSDGFHSLFDGISNIVGYIGITLSSRPPDEKHPYGHRKFETIFTIGIGILIFITCLEIFKKSYRSFVESRTPEVSHPVFIIMVLTLLINIFVNRYEVSRARLLKSEYLLADAGHTSSDIFVTTGVIMGLFLSKLGMPQADAIIGFIIAILIALVGLRIIRSAVDILVDTVQMDKEKICKLVMDVEGVTGCHDIRTRGTKECIFLDLHVEVDRTLSLQDAHDIADRVEEKLKKQIPAIKDVVVHIEPGEAGK
ncbi:MAG: cation diffusion facilitator family transporter [Thermodesulfovibrionales bacterium]|nr:cation diffusion facilitator family transporter [Thermodesulfovibrionales bacterium]